MTAPNVAHLPEQPPGKPKKTASAAAREAEAGDGYVTIEQCGVKLRIGVGENMPAGVIDAFVDADTEDGDEAFKTNWKALREWVGDEQWQQLKAAGMTKGSARELDRKLGELSGN